MAAAGEDLLGSAMDVAVRVTAAEEGIPEGAVYVMAAPEALVEADSVPQALSPKPCFSVQLAPCSSRKRRAGVFVALFVPSLVFAPVPQP